MTMRTQAYPKKKESVIKNSAINLTLLQHNGDKKNSHTQLLHRKYLVFTAVLFCTQFGPRKTS